MSGGQPLIQGPAAYVQNGVDPPYMFQLHAQVSDVSPALGSTAGGTLVAITGKGFPTPEVRSSDTVTVTLGGLPCAVLSSNYTTIMCVTGAQQAAPAGPAAAPFYPGMRGMAYELYDLSNTTTLPALSTLRTTFNQTTTVESSGPASYRAVLSSGFESQDFDVPKACTYARTFFTPRVNNTYSFIMLMDDYGSLYGTYNSTPGVQNQTQLVQTSNYAVVDYYDTARSYYTSAPVSLAAGQSILLEAYQCNIGGTGFFQVGVRTPSTQAGPLSISEKQRLSVTGTYTQRTQVITYMWGMANQTSVNVTVSVPDLSYAALLTSPLVALTFVVNGAAPFNWSLTGSSSSLASLFHTSLGSSVPSSNSSVAVFPTPTSITLTFSVNSTLRPTLTITATPVLLPSPLTPSPTQALVSGVQACPSGLASPPPAPPPSPLPPSPPPVYGSSAPSSPASSPSSSLDLTQLSVTVAPWAVAASSPAGTWLVGPQGTPAALFTSIPWNANSTVVQSALRTLLGGMPLVVSGSPTPFVSGPFYMLSWTVTFTYNASTPPNVTLAVVPGAGVPAGMVCCALRPPPAASHPPDLHAHHPLLTTHLLRSLVMLPHSPHVHARFLVCGVFLCGLAEPQP